MENSAVYNETTEPQVKAPRRPLGCTARRLRGWRLPLKALQALQEQVLTCDGCVRRATKAWCCSQHRSAACHCCGFKPEILSLVAVVCEEIVEVCIKCEGLYFFEFTSFSAFLLSLLILGVYCTQVYETLGEDKVQKVNFWAVLAIGVFFLLASIVLAATISGTAVEKAASVFGFLASGAFLAEFIVEYFHNRKQNVSGCPENPANTQSATENQPLNKQS